MSRGGIIISNNSDGRGMMLPEREGSYTFNKLPFVSMPKQKIQAGLNPIEKKVIINTKRLNIQKEPKKSIKNKFYPLENYRKIKTSLQFWKKNENPLYKEFNKKKEDEKNWIETAEQEQQKKIKTFSELLDKKDLSYSDIEYIKNKKIFSVPKTPQKLIAPLLNVNKNNNTLSANKIIFEDKKEEDNDDICKIKPEIKEVKVCPYEKNDKINDVMTDKLNENIDKKEIKGEKEIKEEKENKENKEDNKEIKKDPLLEDDLDDKENIDDVIAYLNGLDYDKYCKDMEIREALTLLKNKMDQEKEEQKNSEEQAKNKVTIEGVEEKSDNTQEKKENENYTIYNNKAILPEINNKIPEQNKVEIVDEEEEKRKEEIKKYKIAEQIAKTDQMKAVHSVNSIKKLLEREGLDKLKDQPPLKITVIKENPIANMDECQTNKLPFLHSLPLV